MGTKLQSKTYFPGYYSMRDVSNAGNGMWALYDEDKTLQKGQLNDSLLASTMGRYVGYEKEKVRQTILKHELIFRDQLQELHRLYKRQRDLMNEFGRRELEKKLLPAETEKPTLYLSNVPSEDASKRSHASDFYTVCSPFGKPPASDGISQAPLSTIKGKSTCTHDERTHMRDYEFLKPEDKKFQRKMFDLELPAEVYMNDEGKQQGERNCGVEGMEDSQGPSNKGSNCVSNGHALKSMLIERKKHGLADLNEPIWVEETSIRDPANNVGASIPLREDIRDREFLTSDSSSQVCSKEFSQRYITEKDRRTVLNSIHTESDKNGNGPLVYNCKAGTARCDDHISVGNISDEHPSTIFRSLQVDPRKASDTLEFSLSGHSNAAPQRMRTIFGVEISEGNKKTSISNYCSPSSRHLPQQNDALASEPSCIAPRRMTSSSLTQNVVSSQDNLGFRTVSRFTERPPNSLVQMPEIFGDKISNNMRSTPGPRFEASQQSALSFGSQSSVGQQGYLDLNSYVAAANKFQNKVVSQQKFALEDTKLHFSDRQIKRNDDIYQMNLDSLQNRQHFFNNTEIKKCPFTDFTSPTCRLDSGNNGADCCDSKSSGKILGFPICNVPQISKAFNSPVCFSKSTYNASRVDCDGADNVEEKYSVADNGLSNYFTGLRHQIDLNLTLNEEETPSTPSVPIAVVKIASTEIDLEAPAVLESVNDVSVEADHVEKNEMCSKVSLDDSSEQYEELSRVAAEAIINISLSQMDVDPSCQLPEASPPNCLLWLADVISSYEGNGHETKVITGSTNVDSASDEETVPQGMDYFEFMTLKIEETKGEDYCYQPYFSENFDDEDTKATSVSKRPRKGQARRGRQWRDFQRDILPGLVSLSRREVTEDLQTIEEIFKASGQPWQSSLSRRAARNGRGRRRLESSAPSQTAAAVYRAPVQQPACRELEVEDRNLTGWGKRTRRLPRQRCSIGNHMVGLHC